MGHHYKNIPLFFLALFLCFGPARAANPAAPSLHGNWGFVQCTNIVDPANGDTNVPVTSAINWEPAAGSPTAYLLMVGTTPGGTDIVNQDVGNVLTFDPPGNLPFGTTIYVTVIGYNANGPATGCTEESFTTVSAPVPNCTSLTSPTNGATNVEITTALSWASATGGPTGYRLTVGTTPGGTQILNNVDVGNVTSFNPPGDFPTSSNIYVKITPYNGNGNATGCTEESFATSNCTPNLLIANNAAIASGSYASSGDLTSNTSTVPNGNTVVFTSDAGVLLEQDFTVILGAIFEIAIQACQ
jgi:hypothetical protein